MPRSGSVGRHTGNSATQATTIAPATKAFASRMARGVSGSRSSTPTRSAAISGARAATAANGHHAIPRAA